MLETGRAFLLLTINIDDIHRCHSPSINTRCVLSVPVCVELTPMHGLSIVRDRETGSILLSEWKNKVRIREKLLTRSLKHRTHCQIARTRHALLYEVSRYDLEQAFYKAKEKKKEANTNKNTKSRGGSTNKNETKRDVLKGRSLEARAA